jgi:glycosyltransferase involved in cell wall biosynthesis
MAIRASFDHREVSASRFFSVVTVSLNSEPVLPRTLTSLEAQTIDDYEYIVVDGGSEDGTLELLQEHADLVDVLVSEPDRGIYDAMNKGLALARGEYLYFIGAGDELAAPTVLSEVRNAARAGDLPDIVYGDIVFAEGQERRRIRYPKLGARFLSVSAINHQAIFARRDLFARTGSFPIELAICGDFDWLLRAVFGARCNHERLRTAIAVFHRDGISSRDRTTLDAERAQILSERMPRRKRVFWRVAGPLALAGLSLASRLRTSNNRRRALGKN